MWKRFSLSCSSKCRYSQAVWRSLMDKNCIQKVEYLNNKRFEKILQEGIDVMKPKEVFIADDSKEDEDFIRKLAIEQNEEIELDIKGHTVHFDGYFDQARDAENTAVLLPPDVCARKGIQVIDQEEGLKEIFEIMDGIMKDKTLIVKFYSLGPKNSPYSQYGVQFSDSAYVCHSQDMLYRSAFENFKENEDFFYFWHSAGELTEDNVSKNVSERRIYVDPLNSRCFSCNNQYAGNSLGLKKLALRLAVYKSNIEKDWLAEHMFISGFKYNDKQSYFAGAYPSACGKTSTAMIENSSLIGDDIAYFRIGKEGELRGVDTEQGVFGIIKGVNEENDPIIFKGITKPDTEVIFSNVLMKDKEIFWQGNQISNPKDGFNFSGEWFEGKKNENGTEIPISHANARFTIGIDDLSNADENLHDPEGVEISSILYGGRDSDCSCPVFESIDWNHGVFIGSTIESETTAATLGKRGIKKINPFANADFTILPFSKYVQHHIDFGNKLSKCPSVFSTNYFLLDDKGNPLTPKQENRIWIMWITGKVNGDFEGINSPFGTFPKFEEIKELFSKELNENYSEEKYIEQFSFRAKKYFEKMKRVEFFFSEEEMPKEFKEILQEQKDYALQMWIDHGERVSPFFFSSQSL